MHTNAIYAFNNMFENVMQKEMPTHVFSRFLMQGKPHSEQNFYSEYKAGRSKKHLGNLKNKCRIFVNFLEGLGVKIL